MIPTLPQIVNWRRTATRRDKLKALIVVHYFLREMEGDVDLPDCVDTLADAAYCVADALREEGEPL